VSTVGRPALAGVVSLEFWRFKTEGRNAFAPEFRCNGRWVEMGVAPGLLLGLGVLSLRKLNSDDRSRRWCFGRWLLVDVGVLLCDPKGVSDSDVVKRPSSRISENVMARVSSTCRFGIHGSDCITIVGVVSMLR